jgi:hypothetical protein
MFVCCECCVLSGRCFCDELITRPEESYRLWCVVVCDLETSIIRRPWPNGGCRARNKQSLCKVGWAKSRLQVAGSGFRSVKNNNSFLPSLQYTGRPWDPLIFLFNAHRVLFPGVKRPGREFDHTPPPSTDVKNYWSYNYFVADRDTFCSRSLCIRWQVITRYKD